MTRISRIKPGLHDSQAAVNNIRVIGVFRGFLDIRISNLSARLVHWAAAGATVLCPAVAFAQAPPPGAPAHSDAIPLLVALFCIALGVIIICRSANRSSEMKLEELDDD